MSDKKNRKFFISFKSGNFEDKKRGLFIVFEGIDGCGKGTQLKLAHSYLWDYSKQIDVFTTREPTRNFPEIRKKMASRKTVGDDRIWYAQQFTADRINHCEKYIFPLLKKGTLVLCDRYYHSTLTYQNTQGIAFEELLEMQRQKGILIPDLTFIYDCPVEIAFERRREEGATDVFEKDLEFQKKLRLNYLEIPEKLRDEKIILIDSTSPIEKVSWETKKELEKLLQNYINI